MTRIVAGTLGGRTLLVPPRGTRPTSERVREAVFSRLEHLGAVDGAHVLDLYAGSGALALEALSRGASSAVLVESDPTAARVCRTNIANLDLSDRAHVVATPVERHLPTATPADLVFADPPYALDTLDEILSALVDVLTPGGTVVVERPTRATDLRWPEGLVADDDRRYGETHVWTAHRPQPGNA
ncbi:MAG: 16S rRNA (guanine(966)-N(2))-methyltransferase RsmD [Micrococcales bacterium]|nr:16S rRNA (guanine(966)-N(2))-methyltransferase RsmD [Micrococcales bacterium]MCL2666993.1 16S rRNA (guanine(966)-N(2))-methyltransferase RsmD [Micrococcales bacterium]